MTAPPAGHRERDAAIASALARPAADWDRRVVDQAIRTFARSGREFSVNDIRDLLPKVNGSIVGGAFLAASQRKLIVRTGSTTTTHGAGHARRVSTWRGTHTPAPEAAHQPPDLPPTGTDGFYAPRSHTGPPSPIPASPPNEPVWAKARRLLGDGQVRVQAADGDGRITAHVRGDDGRYLVSRTAGGRWSCTCTSGRFGGSCSHRLAVKLIAEAEMG